jgi:hypothetical protein
MFIELNYSWVRAVRNQTRSIRENPKTCARPPGLTNPQTKQKKLRRWQYINIYYSNVLSRIRWLFVIIVYLLRLTKCQSFIVCVDAKFGMFPLTLRAPSLGRGARPPIGERLRQVTVDGFVYLSHISNILK